MLHVKARQNDHQATNCYYNKTQDTADVFTATVARTFADFSAFDLTGIHIKEAAEIIQKVQTSL